MMAWKKPDEELVEFLSREMEGKGDLRKMFGYPVYFVNGNMFMGVHGDDLFLRLSPDDRVEIRKVFPLVRSFTPREGMTMKEYVTLPNTIQDDIENFREWRDRSFHYASSLPPRKKSRKGP